VIEVQTPGRRARRLGLVAPPETAVLSFEVLPHGWSDPIALRSALRRWWGRRRASARVTIWGVTGAHQLVRLPAETAPQDLAALAQAEVVRGSALLRNAAVVSGIAVGGLQPGADGAVSREVAVAAVVRADIEERLRAVAEAGVRIEAVATPPAALCALARLRRQAVPGMPVALLAIGAETTALAIVRDGLLLFAREMSWGHRGTNAREFDRPRFTEKLSSELRRSLLFFKQTTRSEATELVMCGDAPDLRSLTAPLMADLKLHVETLDTLEGIMADALPEPAEAFRRQAAGFRLAWALASDDQPPMTFEVVSPGPPRGVGRVVVATAGLAALVTVAGYVWTQCRPPFRSPAPSEVERPVAEPEVAPPPAGLLRPGEDAGPVRPTAPDAISGGFESTIEEDAAAPAPTTQAPTADEVHETPPLVPEPPIPDPVVQLILYSAERRAALVDGRLVGVGDEVSLGRVAAIEPDAVVIETSAGKRRRLELTRPAAATETPP